MDVGIVVVCPIIPLLGNPDDVGQAVAVHVGGKEQRILHGIIGVGTSPVVGSGGCLLITARHRVPRQRDGFHLLTCTVLAGDRGKPLELLGTSVGEGVVVEKIFAEYGGAGHRAHALQAFGHVAALPTDDKRAQRGCIYSRVGEADVVLLAYPLHVLTDKQAIQRNLEYYISTVPEKRTPAMTKSIYATLYARLGMADKALYWWQDSYLPNLNPPFRVVAEFNGGTNPYFITGAGGTLQALLFGFAGLDITDKGLKQAYRPVLPKEWKSLTIRRQGYHDIVIK